MSLSAEATVHSFCIQCDYAATHLSSREYFCGQCFTVESLWKLTRTAETSQWKQTETLSIALLRSLSFATLCHLPSLVDIQTCQRLLKKKTVQPGELVLWHSCGLQPQLCLKKVNSCMCPLEHTMSPWVSTVVDPQSLLTLCTPPQGGH